MPPKLQLGAIRPVADEKTLEALIANRYEVMASYARGVRQELARIQGDATLQVARRWLHRDADKAPRTVLPQLAQARAAYPALDKMLIILNPAVTLPR